jgi:hypothetical protein
MDRGQDVTANEYAGEQTGEERKYSLPNTGDTLVVVQEDITIEDDFEENQSGIQDAVRVKQQSDWNRQ